jgi:hypothetical protein
MMPQEELFLGSFGKFKLNVSMTQNVGVEIETRESRTFWSENSRQLSWSRSAEGMPLSPKREMCHTRLSKVPTNSAENF